MSDEVVIAVVAALPPTILAAATLVVAVKNSRRSAVRDEKIEEIHKATNSMKDALVVATEKEALARGLKQGAEDEKARVNG